VAEVVSGAVPAHPEHRLDFSMISPGGTRFYVGMSITPAPPEFRDEVRFIFLFRDLAETLDAETDPRLKRAAAEQDARDAAAREPGEAPVAAEAAPPPSPAVVDSELREPSTDATEGEKTEGPRRVVLALRYSEPADLVRRAIDTLAEERAPAGPFVPLEAADDVPEVLIDRQQVTEALTILLARTLDRCGDPARVRVRLTRTEAPGGKGAHPGPAACIEILYPRALITEEDLAPEPEEPERQAYRRTDLGTAEKLVEANGGRLIRPRRDADEQALTVLLRAAR
jgi:hypothetical protein